MRFKIEEVSGEDELPAISVRLRIDGNGDLNLEIRHFDLWRIIAWIDSDGEVGRSITLPLGLRRRAE